MNRYTHPRLSPMTFNKMENSPMKIPKQTMTTRETQRICLPVASGLKYSR